MAVEFLQFTDHEIVVCDGHLVPNLTAHRSKGKVEFVLDNRYGIEIPPNLVEAFVRFVANAMAIGGGYTSFGEHAQPINPYKRRMAGITLNPPDEPPTKAHADE